MRMQYPQLVPTGSSWVAAVLPIVRGWWTRFVEGGGFCWMQRGRCNGEPHRWGHQPVGFLLGGGCIFGKVQREVEAVETAEDVS